MTDKENFFNRRYELLQLLGSGGMGSVYRAWDRLTGRQVALKRIQYRSKTGTASQPERTIEANWSLEDLRMALAQEYETLATLRHKHIISVLDYGFDDLGQPYYTMDLIENPQSILEATRGQTLTYKIEMLLQTLYALAYLHRRSILHRDIKPRNVLVTGDNVKVVDFGVSGAGDPNEDFVGTLAYMSPELILGEGTSLESDLYAFGALAYEVLAGQRAFRSRGTIALIAEICGDMPDMSVIDALEPPAAAAEVRLILERLLAKDPAERYHDSTEVIKHLSPIIGRYEAARRILGQQEILRAVNFIGREYELAMLAGGLSSAVDGRGSVWVIQGESGQGKTRLLEELRVMALVWGALVLPGTATDAGSAFYHVWREPLRRLALEIDLVKRDAAALKAVIPDVEQWLGQPVPDPEHLKPVSAHRRFVETLQAFIRRTVRPLLFVLDDLHLADSASIQLLKSLSREVKDLPVLIVATSETGLHRDLEGYIADSSRDDQALIRLLHLQPLDGMALPNFIRTLLKETDLKHDVVDMVADETGGNVYLIIEMLRALAEEAGNTAAVGQDTVPLRLFSLNEAGVTRRRLELLPEKARELLKVAALAGRTLDLQMLESVRGGMQFTFSLASWLDLCSSMAVLEVYDNAWRFSHDKLRQRLILQMETGERRAYHLRIARALALVYSDLVKKDAAVASALVYHFQQAGEGHQAAQYARIERELAAMVGLVI